MMTIDEMKAHPAAVLSSTPDTESICIWLKEAVIQLALLNSNVAAIKSTIDAGAAQQRAIGMVAVLENLSKDHPHNEPWVEADGRCVDIEECFRCSCLLQAAGIRKEAGL